MNKLPFVWELDYDGVVSHAIGSPHGLRMITFNKYTQDILHHLENKSAVLLEPKAHKRESLDAAIYDIAREQGISSKPICSEQESEAFNAHYSALLSGAQNIAAYQREDEAKLKETYGGPAFNLELINGKLAEHSWRWLRTVPSLLVANLAHFLVEPSLLKKYEEKEIKIKRIQ